MKVPITTRSGAGGPQGPARIVERVLRTPLLTKIVVLDGLINLAVLCVMQITPPQYGQEVTVASLATVLVLNAALVAWALRPLAVLEETTRRVSQGEFHARTRMPPGSDANLLRIGQTLDDLLDRVETERARVRMLASRIVATAEQERARIARELHDGTAQSLSALDMLLASALAEQPDHERLIVMRDIVKDALDEVRSLSQAVHPRVLDDLGLPATLEFLARRTRAATGAEVVVEADDVRLSDEALSVLYRVAQEALHNAAKYADASHVVVRLRPEGGHALLEVEDDGRGFDVKAVEAERRGMGLFVMEERVSLVDGTFSVTSEPGRGTRVRARVPLRPSVETA